MLVVLLFIACNIAALLLNVFEVRLGEILGPYINYVVDASNVLVVFNSSCNFVIYVTFSLAFRRTLRRHILKTNAKLTVQMNRKSSKETEATTTAKTTLATIEYINLFTGKYSSSSKSSNNNNSGGTSSKSNSTNVIANENTTNYNQQYCRHYQHPCYDYRRYQRLAYVEQLTRKGTTNHVPKAALLEVLI